MGRFLRDVPVGGAVLAKMMDDLQSGHWPAWYVDTICQPSRTHTAGAWPMEQIYAFMFVDDWIQRGALAVVDIEVGQEPHRDSQRIANQEALDAIKGPYVAIVDQDQHCGDGDGTLTWTGQISISFRADPGEWNGTASTAWVDGAVTKVAHAPLEIGSTLASTTVFRLGESRALARWPYGSKSIRLFLDTDIFRPVALDRDGRERTFHPTKPMWPALPHLEDLLKDYAQ